MYWKDLHFCIVYSPSLHLRPGVYFSAAFKLPQKQKQRLSLNINIVLQVVELDLNTVVPCCSGPKRPQDKIPVSDMKKDFEGCLQAKVGLNFLTVTSLHRHSCMKVRGVHQLADTTTVIKVQKMLP